MIPKKIEGTEWTVQDWDSQWPPVFSSSKCTVEVDRDGDICIEHDHYEESVRCYVPLEVMAELLRRNGYIVTK